MKFSIYKKLLVGFAVIIILMVAANVYVLWQLNDVTITTSKTFQSDVRSIATAKQLLTILFEEERNAQKYLITHDSTYYALYADQTQLFSRNIDSLFDASPNGEEISVINRIRHGHRWAKRQIESGRMTPETLTEISRRERLDTLDALSSSLNALIRINEEAVSSSVAEISKAMIRSTNVAWVITGSALVVAVCVALLITGTIVRPIRSLIRGTESIARGAFDPIEVRSRDEMALLATAVNDMSAKLKQINDLKTEMLHHISHELRTPLQTMLSAQYLLMDQKRGPLNADQMRLVQSIKDGVKKLTHFSNQFLDIQKIEHGSMEYHFTRTQILTIVEPAVEDTRIVAAQKDVALEFVHDGDLPDVVIDTEKISQVFSNLLSNAIKYTEPKGVITVGVHKNEKGIVASVSDTGAGIPKEDLPRIFAKFYQAKNAKKGTGIGLALVKALVEGHNGSVSVESELGKGTTFTVTLPSAPPAETAISKNIALEGAA